MDLQVICSGEQKSEVKTRKSEDMGPETEWSMHEQFESTLRRWRRNELVIVARIWEDLCIGVKCQSNSEIAGFLRKL